MRRILSCFARYLPTAWLVLALLLATFAACSDVEAPSSSGRAPGRGVYIGAAWHTSRNVTGHRVHVIKEKIACAKCHEITDESIGAVIPGRCADCHEKEARIEHAQREAQERFGPDAKADCTTCHAFTWSGSDPDAGPMHVHAAGDCKRCHLEAQGDTPGVIIHADTECVKCHRPHEDASPKPAPCVDCHKDVKATHAAHGKSGPELCTPCHQHQHAPASDARPTCAECHSKERPLIPKSALFSDGHTECVGCHRPHDFEKEAAVPCGSCHENIAVLAAPRVRQHDRCASCHAPHDVRGSPDKACAGCHKDIQPNHPKHGDAGTCVGCHDPHPGSARRRESARSCSTCHQTAASDKSFHGSTGCTQCHKPHEFVRSASDLRACEACHAKPLNQVATLAGHQACDGCHGGLPHRPATLTAGCDTCHTREHQQATRGHSKCTSCHEPHGGSVGVACQSCHKEEHKSAPAGHQNCQSCHQAHSGKIEKATCVGCHAEASRTEHGGLTTGCATCHRAHGPGGVREPPACATCHKTAGLPGLHQVDRHKDCAGCHTGHGEAMPGSRRAGCLTCHTDRKNHYPDAGSCASCHLFDKMK